MFVSTLGTDSTRSSRSSRSSRRARRAGLSSACSALQSRRILARREEFPRPPIHCTGGQPEDNPSPNRHSDFSGLRPTSDCSPVKMAWPVWLRLRRAGRSAFQGIWTWHAAAQLFVPSAVSEKGRATIATDRACLRRFDLSCSLSLGCIRFERKFTRLRRRRRRPGITRTRNEKDPARDRLWLPR